MPFRSSLESGISSIASGQPGSSCGVVRNGSAQMAYSRAVSSWFEKRRGTATVLDGASVRDGVTSRVSDFDRVLFSQSIAPNGTLTHMAALLTDRGVPASGAALALSAIGAASLFGRLTTGWLLDRFVAPRVGFCLLSVGRARDVSAGGSSLGVGVLAAALIGFGHSSPLAFGRSRVLMTRMSRIPEIHISIGGVGVDAPDSSSAARTLTGGDAYRDWNIKVQVRLPFRAFGPIMSEDARP